MGLEQTVRQHEQRMTRLEEILVELHQQNKERHDEYLKWNAHLAALTVQMDRRLKESQQQTHYLADMLREMRAERRERNGTA